MLENVRNEGEYGALLGVSQSAGLVGGCGLGNCCVQGSTPISGQLKKFGSPEEA